MDTGKRFEGALPKGATTEELQHTFKQKQVLFYIEKSQNTNCVVYEANVVDGKLDQVEPLKVYWILYARDPIIEEGLNMIERTTAYGKTLKSIDGKPGHFKVTLAALKTLHIDLYMDETGICHSQIMENNEACELLHVYVQTKSW
eukprot:CAMPEP_0204838490 /NCGR_PEP_ID=MMETSP1346-20131115/31170_1 /ASSEMBLY_ACC=CAM_ASM_000771 /TAXON_ID=215587 /ORGANISM="Aplanochytrium stocchinoi, Strain GSBS06" /LENGTH=144 /DNA_ID=CAMNT_0051974607 /DNA_START=234 /DNA_END=665 /DNA_ORIENTATION=-